MFGWIFLLLAEMFSSMFVSGLNSLAPCCGSPNFFSGLSVIYRDGEIEVWVGIDRCLSRSIECVGDRLRENHYSGFDGVVMVWD